MSGIEGVGDAVTGGMFARAIEPEAGEAAHDAGGKCLNCGAALVGPYCRMCGQKGHVHRTISAIGHDLIHGILHLDGKFWRALPLLAWRPGDLTRRYVHGERAKFVSPLGMFLFSIFLMFAVLQIFGLSLSNLDMRSSEVVQRNMNVARQEVVRELREAHDRRAAFARGERVVLKNGQPATLDALDREIAGAQEGVDAVQELSTGTGRFIDADFDTGWPRLDHGIEKFNQNPGLALYKLQANGYKFSWLLIPISVPFVWLLFFWTRRFRFYDHTVFVTYSLAFMSLFAILLTLSGMTGLPSGIIAIAAMIVPPFHIYRQLKGAYSLGRFGTLVRTFLLVNFCFVTASFFFLMLLGIGALG
ncbi:DUF3667 domain-containing protein [Sphingosinicella sp. LHD-64]|uniref:DUF3667 domain-containing protein n=1 Tax=Sphingosinicella sp. LHD-64 TaxID=3072139 RepID=UPI0028105D3E|nr:DUF3667 domain-containing protein [Sphingosinicella sp. LHD-64]MDQ8756061.1 DUF3667 domain-containing protein [Sphingosinicella sp. LHD-64]